ncbi:TusE/DsrC/DsvC family sulfur relay protein [Buchnera aphidicola]|uniref:TusE/DsrC/DsvC family sulfur relay protein n=1 Tax=Buchnera aphidicola TaxID=9 RepID=UPI003464462A
MQKKINYTTNKMWNNIIANKIAKQESINMTKQHWEIINLIRDFYLQFQIIAPNRVLLKIIQEKLGKEKSNSKYLLSLFPKGISKQANKIAGLPKSKICL